jgi:hypothetical protein
MILCLPPSLPISTDFRLNPHLLFTSSHPLFNKGQKRGIKKLLELFKKIVKNRFHLSLNLHQ